MPRALFPVESAPAAPTQGRLIRALTLLLATVLIQSPPALAAVSGQGAAASTTMPPAEVEAPAATPPGYDPAILDTCLSLRHGVIERAGCIGLAAARCTMIVTAAPPEEFAACALAERDQWQAQLDELLDRLRDTATATDSATEGADARGRRNALDAAQTAWEDWRSAECQDAGIHAGGSGGEAVAEAECEMTLTAERANALYQRVTRSEGP